MPQAKRSKAVGFRWSAVSGGSMIPLAGSNATDAAERFTIGWTYWLEENQESEESRGHYFRAIGIAWHNMPEHYASQFPSKPAMRKKVLIAEGFRHQQSIVCQDEEQAERLAAFIRSRDDFAVVSIHGPVVVVLEAETQSKNAMGKARFEESKTAVIDHLNELLRWEPGRLAREAARQK